MQGIARLTVFLLGLLLLPAAARAAEPRLLIEIDGASRSFSREDLLRHPAAADIDVPQDASYGRAMRYRAVPMAALLAGARLLPGQALEAVSSDGFAAQLPVQLVLHPAAGAAAPYLAVEPAGAPWPNLPGKQASAGPFYIVWLRPAASDIRSEQWPYMIAAIRSAESPA